MISLLLLTSSQVLVYAASEPKNIILFIGDGMGLSQVTAAQTVKGALTLDHFKSIGLCTTHAANSLVTDSAAAGTALATGYKTNKGMIGVTSDGKDVPTVLEIAEEKGLSTGLVVTCTITHATPASFYAHINDRGKETIIAKQLLDHDIEVIFGGGMENFVSKEVKGSKRKDDANLTATLMANGYTLYRSDTQLTDTNDMPEKVAGFFAMGAMPKLPKYERKPSLEEMTEKAISILSKNKKGFFLMVEGSQIDWAGHENNNDYLIAETMDFDDAVKIGYEFAKKNKNTLVIVTADHETGGMAITGGSKEKKNVDLKFAADYHSATMVPVFSYGPGEEAFQGIMDNTDIGKKMIGFLK